MATPQLTPDFRELLSLLNSTQTEYLVIGGFAVGVYGYVRPTKDLDLFISIDNVNLQRLVTALVGFGFSPNSIAPATFQSGHSNFRIGRRPNSLELITQIAGVQFDECYDRRVMTDFGAGLIVPVISLEDLRRNKLATGRLRDQADIQQLDRRLPPD